MKEPQIYGRWAVSNNGYVVAHVLRWNGDAWTEHCEVESAFGSQAIDHAKAIAQALYLADLAEQRED